MSPEERIKEIEQETLLLFQDQRLFESQNRIPPDDGPAVPATRGVLLRHLRAIVAEDRAEQAKYIKAITGLDTPPDRHPIGVVLDAYQSVRAEERRRCMAAVCSRCANGEPVRDSDECNSLGHQPGPCHSSGVYDGRVTHIRCHAAAIRARTP